ncbi:MAG: polysaccharide export protein [Parasporobacterium sp.]|nr:polysaccharide export protein [Parasporobacterium sp.]
METNTQMQQTDDVVTIDLVDLAKAVWRSIWLVIIGIIVGAVLAFVITKVFIVPKYQATSTIYILSQTTSITSLADLQIGSQLAADFEIIATTREVLEKVIETEHLDKTYEELKKEISVSNPQDSHMLRISVTDPDPELAARISNSLADELREEIAEIMNTDRPSSVEKAVVPKTAFSPSVQRNVILGAVILAILAIIIIIVRHLSDDTIKSDEDVRKYLALDTLAQFPLIKSRAAKTGKK